MNDGDGRPWAEPETYRTLLESTRAIPWKIDWASMRFAYIGPQIEPLLGWSPQSWATVQDWAERIHADDRERVVSFCVAQSQAGVDHEADYRALTADGDYVWIRDVVHVVRDADGAVEALVGFMFDISERKRAEEQVLRLQAELEVLSYTDALTGLANRRRFDAVMAQAWAQAARTQERLALAMFDIDDFKPYNDAYGHLQGDACLKQVAGLLAAAVTAPDALLARFGGEEFALVLPGTSAAAAGKLLLRLKRVVSGLMIQHEQRLVTITASFGMASHMDGERRFETHEAFVKAADEALYAAKHAGRDRVAEHDASGTGFIFHL
jgi:diguanylate cyclase (GGDEF)-like protein/PAS domain S-box-containing protein